jgi:hypothetical protein
MIYEYIIQSVMGFYTKGLKTCNGEEIKLMSKIYSTFNYNIINN